MAEPQSVWSEMASVLRNLLGLNQDTSWPIRGADKGHIEKGLMRIDGSAKGPGFFGPQAMTGEAEGNYATELSIGTAPNSLSEKMSKHPEGFYPLISESQDPTTMSWILAGRRPTKEMYATARNDAKKRKAEGKGAFASGVALPGTVRDGNDFGPYNAPKKLKRLNKAQMQEAMRLMQNHAAYEAMSKPGAMALDAPAMPYLQPKDRKAFFEKHGVLYRQSGPATSDQLPPGTVVTQPPKEWK